MQAILCHTRYDLMVFEKEWSVYFQYPTLESAKGMIPSIAHAHPEYSRFKVVRMDENVLLEEGREQVLNTPCSQSQAAVSCP